MVSLGVVHTYSNPASISASSFYAYAPPNREGDTEENRYLVLALRNRKVKQNDTVKLLVPRDNSIVKEILEKVKKTIHEIKVTPIEQLEEEINELVYQLYGLNENDKAVTEGFLKKF